MVIGCPCRDRHIGTTQVLQHPCTCGSVPLRHNGGQHRYRLLEELKVVLIHNLKDKMLQVFLCGSSLEAVFTGHCKPLGDDAPDGLRHSFEVDHVAK